MPPPDFEPDDPADAGRLDPFDPRFEATAEPSASRRLVRSRGPGPSPEDPNVRILRIALPLLFAAGIGVIALVFFTGLRPGPQTAVLGRESAVRAAVEDRPRRVCFNDNNPCAWITVVRERLVAFNTNGPLPQEYGRAGVGWCPTSGWFGANATGSRFDQDGTIARGPAPRGLDRFAVTLDQLGRVVVDFAQLTAGVQVDQVREVRDPGGPHCETIPFDREADLPPFSEGG